MPTALPVTLLRALLRPLALILFAGSLGGCIVGTVVDAATSVAVGTIKVGAAVVGGTVKVAAAGVKAATSDDAEDKEKTAGKDGQTADGKPADGATATPDAPR